MRERKVHIPTAENRVELFHPGIRGARVPAAATDASRWIDMWAGRALMETKADRPRVERALRSLYELSGHKAPDMFMWVKSPAAIKKIRAAFKNIRKEPSNPKWFYIVNEVGKHIKNKMPYWDDALSRTFAKFIEHHAGHFRGLDNGLDSTLFSMIEIAFEGSGISKVQNRSRTSTAFAYLCPQFHPSAAANFYYQRTALARTFEVLPTKVFEAYADLVAAGSMWVPYRGFVLVCERPIRISLDERARLHDIERKAIEWPDGYGVYALSGVRVQEKYILHPETLSPEVISHEPNAEVRRTLIQIYGEERFLFDSKARIVSYGRNGTKLWCCEFRPKFRDAEDENGFMSGRFGTRNFNDEPFQMVEVVNSTPEPDGSFKHYFLRVPPTIQDADEAVAWTFNLDKSLYVPEQES